MLAAPERLSAGGRERLTAPESELHLSAASAWEIAIKHALGKLRLPVTPAEYLRTRMARTRTIPLPIRHEHALRVGELPLHHRDPFDRILVAQAQLEGLRIMTADGRFSAYDVEILDP
jgi:PIN domain nuclease of toxin-antitoxin system